MNPYQFTGIHFLASYCGCDQTKLTDIRSLQSILDLAVNASGATILGRIDHVFEGDLCGYT
jgi:S-adenosylmethionine/arginine decarboxylase-like enzyme